MDFLTAIADGGSPTCDLCFFSQRVEPEEQDDLEGAEMYECHFLPPTIVSSYQDYNETYPVVNADDWCGQWKGEDTAADADAYCRPPQED